MHAPRWTSCTLCACTGSGCSSPQPCHMALASSFSLHHFPRHLLSAGQHAAYFTREMRRLAKHSSPSSNNVTTPARRLPPLLSTPRKRHPSSIQTSPSHLKGSVPFVIFSPSYSLNLSAPSSQPVRISPILKYVLPLLKVWPFLLHFLSLFF